MKSSPLPTFSAIATLAVFAFAAPFAASADTYQITFLNSDQGYHFLGMDDAGHVTLDSLGYQGCSQSGGHCYYNFLNGVSTGQSRTAPTFTFDNGTPCSPTLPGGGSVEHGVCNDGKDAFTGFLSKGQIEPDVYTGTAPPDFLASGGGGPIFMNTLGDIVFDDHFSEEFYEAIDLTPSSTPEPSSILLLGTGLLAAATMLHRRNNRQPQPTTA